MLQYGEDVQYQKLTNVLEWTKGHGSCAANIRYFRSQGISIRL